MSGRITCCFLAAMICMGSSAWAQDPPEALSPLLITEVMPNPSPGQCPWIEIFNPGDQPVSLDNLFLRAGPDRRYPTNHENALRTLGNLPGGDHLLIFLRPVGDPLANESGISADGSHCRPRQTDVQVLGDRPALFDAGASAGGELALYRETSDGSESIDYISWGRPGDNWSSEYRKAIWPEHRSINVEETFGVSRQTSRIPIGWSIGCYPGTPCNRPGDWIVFDSQEIELNGSQGKSNPIPRPKTFTLANGAVIGTHSFAVSWVGNRNNDMYLFELSDDKEFSNLIVREFIATPTIRVAVVQKSDTYYYRITAFSNGRASSMSETMQIAALPSACDWPALPAPHSQEAVENFGMKPKCPNDLECGIISSIQFKYQRKDTGLYCCRCLVDPEPTPATATSMCPYMGVHPRCFKNEFVEAAPSFIHCAGGGFSPTCGTRPVRHPYGHGSTLSTGVERLWTPLALDGGYLIERHCGHGAKNCARASISMVVSAYGGACLSQDVIAHRHYDHRKNSNQPILPIFDLGHGASVKCDGRAGSECSTILREALGIPENLNNKDVFHVQRATPLFDEIQTWIGEGRPIMSGTDDHVRVVVGYCEDGPETLTVFKRKWLYIFDPRSGPRAETFESWSATAAVTWVAPPNKIQYLNTLGWSPSMVHQDPPGVWQDSDGDGFTNYDNNYRFPVPNGCVPP